MTEDVKKEHSTHEIDSIIWIPTKVVQDNEDDVVVESMNGVQDALPKSQLVSKGSAWHFCPGEGWTNDPICKQT